MTILFWPFKHEAGAGRILFLPPHRRITDVKVATAIDHCNLEVNPASFIARSAVTRSGSWKCFSSSVIFLGTAAMQAAELSLASRLRRS